MTNELTTYTHLAQSNKNLAVSTHQNEFISLREHVIAYRNSASVNVFNLIDQIIREGHTNLLLVRQNDMYVSLLWTLTIPQKYRMYRQPVEITIGKETFVIVASITICQE
jgi:hypothetical protein